MYSWLLVIAQIALILLLLLTTRLPAALAGYLLAIVLVTAGGLVGLAALAANRPGNFNVRPEVKQRARLVTGGIYANVRHPMYLAVLLVTLGTLATDAQPWRIVAWAALLAVLLAKAAREEQFLLTRFPEYAAYRARTRRLLPGVY